jgi:hypothetical protein
MFIYYIKAILSDFYISDDKFYYFKEKTSLIV